MNLLSFLRPKAPMAPEPWRRELIKSWLYAETAKAIHRYQHEIASDEDAARAWAALTYAEKMRYFALAGHARAMAEEQV